MQHAFGGGGGLVVVMGGADFVRRPSRGKEGACTYTPSSHWSHHHPQLTRDIHEAWQLIGVSNMYKSSRPAPKFHLLNTYTHVRKKLAFRCKLKQISWHYLVFSSTTVDILDNVNLNKKRRSKFQASDGRVTLFAKLLHIQTTIYKPCTSSPTI